MSPSVVTPSAGTGLLDAHGRVADDLRISLTERCNLRCTYCMPAEGLPLAPDDALMTRSEIARLATLAVRELGVRSIRLTGGEPLLRRDLVEIVGDLAPLDVDLSLTTNAVGLASRAQALADAGLERINISLDTLDPTHAQLLSRRSLLPRVLEGIDAAEAAGLTPIKINAVLMPGVNDGDDAVELLEWCLGRDFELRFIEQMPLDADRTWDHSTFVTAAQVRTLLEERGVALRPHPAPRDGAPAERFDVYAADGTRRGTIGIIASISEPFCADCRRTRLTAEGTVRHCLFARTETDLLGPLRDGAGDAELAELWRTAMWGKPAAHGIDASFVAPERSMSQIGG
ncbi:GTP 3',8-cyclase MoaA [Aeromicrobium phragmitis]|uniref:GTP 3',8-cyclase n=1 Tax=Aeromicrobium phragmitis TaxID=2478914 RepID=A0A3L8PNH7_9ACTN|nr:GTP 3',8-cyclase MoaA [Aeromicrobium phragmitis]RLV56967.1 GTP 3',8-cyclase MoaA [Aeromicrobium phragmitis]